MKHVILKRPLRDYEDRIGFAKELDNFTANGYKVLNCDITDGGRLIWAILQKEDKHAE